MSTIDSNGRLHDGSGRFSSTGNSRPSGSIAPAAPEPAEVASAPSVGMELSERGHQSSFNPTAVNTGAGFRSGFALRVRHKGSTSRVANFWTDDAGDTRVRIDTAFGSETGMLDLDAVPLTNPTPEEVADVMLAD